MYRFLLWAIALTCFFNAPVVFAQSEAPPEEEQGEADQENIPAEDPEPIEEDFEDPYEPVLEQPTQPQTICEGRRITRIRVEGTRRVDPDDVRAAIDLRRGLPCTDTEVTRAARTIWNLGYFDDLVVEADPVDNDIELTIHVVERPAIGRIAIEGNDELSDEDIDEEMRLQEGAILSISDVREQVTKLRDLYAEEGYFLARITYDINELPGDRGEVEVRFNIEEGAEVTVRRIRFVGNENLSADELSQFMQTSESGFFSFLSDDDTFNTSFFDEDVLRLQAYYYDQGFLTVSIGTPRIELTSDRQHIDITIPIEEGPRFRIGDFEVTEVNVDGLDIDPLEPDLRDLIDLESGDWFSRSSIALGIQEITRIYRDEGYARVELVPGTDLDQERRVVDVNVQIQRGPPVRIERINISGNTKTRDSVIRRELQILEGELYSMTKIERSRMRLLQLRYFERADFSEETGSRDDLIVINIDVAERPTGTFQVGAGFSSIESFILTAQVQQQNLFGHGQQLSFQLQFSGIRRLFSLRFVEPWFLDTRWSLGVEAFYQARQFRAFNRDSVGGSVTLGHPVGDPRLRVFLQYQLEHITISPNNSTLFTSGDQFDTNRRVPFDYRFRRGLTSSLRLSFTWDSRIGGQFRTTDGWHASISTELAESFLGSEQRFVETSAFVRFYKPIWKGLIFRANLTFGHIYSPQNGGVRYYERYFLGGIFDIRGYRLQSIGPRSSLGSGNDPNQVSPAAGNGYPGGIPIGGNIRAYYQLELEFPIFEAFGLYGVAFADGGNAWNLEGRFCESPPTADDDPAASPCGFNPFAIRTSVGAGLRWISPLGPLRFEFGFPLRRRSYEEVFRFEFNIGTSF